MASPAFSAFKGDILVVDDMADNLRLLSTMLTEQGYKVRKVLQGELVFGVVEVNPPDLILLDIIMPKMNGFEVCQQLKNDPKTREIPIIFLSASDETLDKIRAFSVGAEDYITKPFEILEVVARIENQLRIVRLQQQLLSQNYQLQQEVRERQRAEASLQEINQSLEERVGQRTQELTQANAQLQAMGEQLRSALDQEQELSNLKSRIITTISHEYRTPLGIISSSTGLLEEYYDRLPDEMRRKHLGRIQDAVKHMTRLIEDSLFLSPADAHAQLHGFTLVDLQQFMNLVLQELSLSFSHLDRIQIHWASPPTAQYLDPILTHKVLLNLLSNGLKFSEAPQPVDCTLSVAEEILRLTVRDRGIGIPLNEQKKIFEPFYRAANVGNAPGLGVGLSVVHRCLATLGGTISLMSQDGEGTTVTVQIPCSDRLAQQQMPN
ncbi:MAG: hybrid sensor histidine kinase/response regulator [Prochlorothrix sp.]|nr:hybrid sensor histidine kinase/response regulator [Prochlorothrix sp.]